jgi:hypothetical protein
MYRESSYEIVRALAGQLLSLLQLSLLQLLQDRGAHSWLFVSFLCFDEIVRHCGKANQTSSITTWHRPSRSGKRHEDLNH